MVCAGVRELTFCISEVERTQYFGSWQDEHVDSGHHPSKLVLVACLLLSGQLLPQYLMINDNNPPNFPNHNVRSILPRVGAISVFTVIEICFLLGIDSCDGILLKI